MNRFRVLTAALAGTFIYVLVTLIGGRDGFWAMKQLKVQKREISTHTVSIQKVNDELSLEALALQKDMDLIAAYARNIGYVGKDEKLIKVSGLPSNQTRIYDPGTVVKHTSVKYFPESTCKAIGFIVFALVYLILILYDLSTGSLTSPNRKIRRQQAVNL